jgi:hypothetical protein
MYLSYSEYVDMGGVLDETAFSLLAKKAEYHINAQASGMTGARIKRLCEVPECIKECVYELVSLFNLNKSNDRQIASESQSQGGTSESISYVQKTDEEISLQAENIICDFFYGGGMGHLLYRGID